MPSIDDGKNALSFLTKRSVVHESPGTREIPAFAGMTYLIRSPFIIKY